MLPAHPAVKPTVCMKKLFYIGLAGLFFFEVALVYFIMPLPGSQEGNSLSAAYFLHSWRWVFRGVFGALVLLGLRPAFARARWLPALGLLLVGSVAYLTNFKMAADTMFYQPATVRLAGAAANTVPPDRLVLGVAHNGQAKAYPIQYLGYHHQVRDTLGGKPVMVTYCTVCRSGRVFEPLVKGRPETFRLVGMDRFNALFEDAGTGSWWRQATGEAVAGKLKGTLLPELPSTQTTLAQWLQLYPHSLVLQPDAGFAAQYSSLSNYERGGDRGRLTRRDTGSWQPKSWVVGVTVDKRDKAYDWNRLQKERIIYDVVGGHPVALILAQDHQSFVLLERTSGDQTFTLRHDTLLSGDNRYSLLGTSLQGGQPHLKKWPAYQEYWHSWKTFHPGTGRDE